jgi:protein TonB
MSSSHRAALAYAAAFAAAVALHVGLITGLGGVVRTAGDRDRPEPAPAEEQTLAVTFYRPEPVSLAQEPAAALTRLREPVIASRAAPEPSPELEQTEEPVVTPPPPELVSQAAVPEPPRAEPRVLIPETEPAPASKPAAQAGGARGPQPRAAAASTAPWRAGLHSGTRPVRSEKARPLKPIDVEALYPLGARLRGEEGAVRLRVRIGADGRVEGLEIRSSSGFASLDRAAEWAVRQTRFAPATRDARPVADDLTITIRFQLDS